MIDDAARRVGSNASVAVFPKGGVSYSRGPREMAVAT